MGRKRIEARIKKEAVEAVKSGKLTQSEASQQLRLPLIITPKPSTSSPPTQISRKSAIQAHCLHAK